MADEDIEQDNEATAPRPFWSGVVTFGLVNLPVSLFSAYRGKGYALKMVDEDGTAFDVAIPRFQLLGA